MLVSQHHASSGIRITAWETRCRGKAKAGKPITFKSILNTVSFAVIVKPNESLGDLAMQYLGDFDRDRTRQIKNSMLN
jgi:hypothetical protein